MISTIRTPSSQHTKALLGVLLFGLLLNTSAIDWGIPNVHSWNPDDIAPVKPLRVVQTYISGWDKYPLLQSWIDVIVYAPLLLYWSAIKTFDPACQSNIETCFSDPYGQLSILLILSRLISAFMAAGAVYWTYRSSLVVFQDRLAAVLGALLLTCSNALVFSAHVGTVDVPYLFWFTWSIYHYLRIVETNETRHYLAFGVLSACALATKEQIVGAYVLTGVVIYVVHVKRMLRGMQAINISSVVKAHTNIRLAGLVAALLLTYGLINNVFFNSEGYAKHFTRWVGGSTFSSPPRVSDASASRATVSRPRVSGAPVSLPDLSSLRQLKRFIKNLRDALSFPVFLLCLVGAAYGLIRNYKGVLLLTVPAVSYYFVTIQSLRFSILRFSLPVVVLLAVFGGLVAARLCRIRSPWRWLCVPLIALVFSYGFLKSANLVWVMRNDSRYRAEDWLVNHVPKTAIIGVFSFPTYLPRFELLGYKADRISYENMSIEHIKDKGPSYLVLTSKYYGRYRRGKPKEFLDALFGGKLNYHPVFDYRYHSPLNAFVGEWYIGGFVNPRILIFKRTRELS